MFIFLFIAGEFGLYVLIRQLVNGKEWVYACECFHGCLVTWGSLISTRERKEGSIAQKDASLSDL